MAGEITGLFEILENRALAPKTMGMKLRGDTSRITRPGQFVNIKLDGHFLRRPISVCDWAAGELTLIYKTVGHGTEYMAGLKPGAVLDVMTGLGNGYDMEKSGERPLLIGGGAGVPPMYGLCKRLVLQGKRPTVILGFNTKAEMFAVEDFESLGVPTIVTTVDKSYGVPGFVTDGMETVEDYTYFYTCGPMPMLKAVNGAAKTSGQFSFEERMGCGFGACMGCTCKTKYGNKRICRDGPVLEREEIIW